MAKETLSDTKCKTAKPKEKDYQLSAGGGLSLLVKANGSKLWRFVYRIDGKQNRLGFGAYPAISLKQARDKAHEAQAQIANGIDPSNVKKEARQALQLAQSSTKAGKRQAYRF